MSNASFPQIKVTVIRNPNYNGPVTEAGYEFVPYTFEFTNKDGTWRDTYIRVTQGPDDIWDKKLAAEMARNFAKVWKIITKQVNDRKIGKQFWTNIEYNGRALGAKFNVKPAEINDEYTF